MKTSNPLQPRTPRVLRIGTRGSPLALWQAEFVGDLLGSLDAGVATEIVTIRSAGERFPDRRLADIGVGVFTREIDAAVLDGRVDLGVHSLKDVPTALPDGLVIAAVPERASPFDAWVSASGVGLEDLPGGARIGTSSPRRAAQILHRRPDLDTVPMRGNVQTRLRRVDELGLAGTILAEAGLRRLGREDVITATIPCDWILPAVGQGAIAVVTAGRHEEVNELLRRADHADSRRRVEAERAFLRTLRGGCQVPAGALARVDDGDGVHIEGVICSLDGRRLLRGETRGAVGEEESAGRQLAEELLGRGGEEILTAIRDGQQEGGG